MLWWGLHLDIFPSRNRFIYINKTCLTFKSKCKNTWMNLTEIFYDIMLHWSTYISIEYSFHLSSNLTTFDTQLAGLHLLFIQTSNRCTSLSALTTSAVYSQLKKHLFWNMMINKPDKNHINGLNVASNYGKTTSG